MWLDPTQTALDAPLRQTDREKERERGRWGAAVREMREGRRSYGRWLEGHADTVAVSWSQGFLLLGLGHILMSLVFQPSNGYIRGWSLLPVSCPRVNCCFPYACPRVKVAACTLAYRVGYPRISTFAGKKIVIPPPLEFPLPRNQRGSESLGLGRRYTPYRTNWQPINVLLLFFCFLSFLVKSYP
jgi:hypothetical protein